MRKPPLNAHAYVSSGARGLNIGSRLHTHPYVVHASSEGSCESTFAHARLNFCCSTMHISTKLPCVGSYMYSTYINFKPFENNGIFHQVYAS